MLLNSLIDYQLQQATHSYQCWTIRHITIYQHLSLSDMLRKAHWVYEPILLYVSMEKKTSLFLLRLNPSGFEGHRELVCCIFIPIWSLVHWGFVQYVPVHLDPFLSAFALRKYCACSILLGLNFKLARHHFKFPSRWVGYFWFNCSLTLVLTCLKCFQFLNSLLHIAFSGECTDSARIWNQWTEQVPKVGDFSLRKWRGVSIDGGTPKWLVSMGKCHWNGWFGGTPMTQENPI